MSPCQLMPSPAQADLWPPEDRDSRIQKDTGRLLFVGGLILIACSLNTLVLSSLPVRLLQADWQLQFASTLLSVGSLGLVGVLMLCTAPVFPPSDLKLEARVSLCRRLCTWVAMAYLVLIPIQLYAGVRLLNQQSAKETLNQKQWQSFRNRLEASRSEGELRSLLGTLPQPIALPERLQIPLPTLKQRLITEVESRFNALTYQTDGARSRRWQDFLLEAARNCLQSLLLGIGFAAVAQRHPGESTLLERLVGLTGRGRHSGGTRLRRSRG